MPSRLNTSGGASVTVVITVLAAPAPGVSVFICVIWIWLLAGKEICTYRRLAMAHSRAWRNEVTTSRMAASTRACCILGVIFVMAIAETIRMIVSAIISSIIEKPRSVFTFIAFTSFLTRTPRTIGLRAFEILIGRNKCTWQASSWWMLKPSQSVSYEDVSNRIRAGTR